ncbi:hypothetical protein DOY81_005857 [Sarcophaga bullata]|nr:hypothetical protein DOY81_005857 [Sarcophaga bullata]
MLLGAWTYLFRMKKAEALYVDLGELELDKQMHLVTVETTMNEMLRCNSITQPIQGAIKWASRAESIDLCAHISHEYFTGTVSEGDLEEEN